MTTASRCRVAALIAVLASPFAAGPAWAQASTIDAADTAWMMASTAHWGYSKDFYNRQLNPTQRQFFHGFVFDPPEPR